MALSRPVERAVLRESHRPARRPLRPLARYPQQGLPARSFRERAKISRSEDRRARQEYSRRVVLRLCQRRRRAEAFSQPGLRRSRGEKMGSAALLHGPELLQRQESGPALSRRHVLRFLPRRSNPGAQYFWVDRIFFWDKDEASFAFQLFHTSLPGTLDTSFISTDYINNPRTMNAVYSVLPRLGPALRWGKEKLAGGGLKNKQFQDFQQTAALAQFYKAPDAVMTPRVL